jgi:putative ABC transport system substrate-binding protein
MISRRSVLLVGAATWAGQLAAKLQAAERVYRVGLLNVGRRPTSDMLAQGPIVSKLRELGWEEGRNLTIEYSYTESVESVRQLARDVVASKPDVLVALGPFPAHALKDATQTIPIVFGAVSDPVGRGLVSSISRPDGNITGISHYVGPMVSSKSVELLRQILPRAQRVAWLINPANPVFLDGEVERQRADDLRRLNLSLLRIEARSADALSSAFETAARGRADAVIVTADAIFSSERDRIVKLADKYKLPAAYTWRGFVDAGGLVSYGADIADVYRRTAVYVDRVLRGAKPADLPIEQPTNFELAVNLKTARALKITIPRAVLLQATAIIE